MAQIMIPPASKNVQMARIKPKILIPPSDFFDENITKYPTTIQNVAGTRENQIHINILLQDNQIISKAKGERLLSQRI
jgi:hypothetical protein